jgi:SRSO17 transposase
LDRRLHLPREWAEEPARREAAKDPKALVFETKPEQALAMLEHAVAQGGRCALLAGDEVYGDSPEFRAGVEALCLASRPEALARLCIRPPSHHTLSLTVRNPPCTFFL